LTFKRVKPKSKKSNYSRRTNNRKIDKDLATILNSEKSPLRINKEDNIEMRRRKRAIRELLKSSLHGSISIPHEREDDDTLATVEVLQDDLPQTLELRPSDGDQLVRERYDLAKTEKDSKLERMRVPPLDLGQVNLKNSTLDEDLSFL
jgi:hypothetical protein